MFCVLETFRPLSPKTILMFLLSRLHRRENRKINIVLGERGRNFSKTQNIECYCQVSKHFCRELTNRRLSHDGAVGSPCVPASSSYRNLKLRITVKTTTFMRDKLFIYEITLVVFYKYTRQTNKMC